MRASRAGNGDVSAGYLMAYELVIRHGFEGEIIFIVDNNAKKILSKISGLSNISNGTALIMQGTNANNLICYEEKGIPLDGSVKPADIYISLAKPSGNMVGSEERYLVDHKLPNSSAWIPVTKNTFYVFQTVLGNTENKYERYPLATVNYKGLNFLMQPAGIGPTESGIYWDYVAALLRGKNKSQIVAYLSKVLMGLSNQRDKSVIEGLVVNKQKILKDKPNIKIGLVYGVSHEDVKNQFSLYVKGLSAYGKKKGEAYIILTPSDILKEDLEIDSATLYETDSVVDFEKLNNEPGKVTFIKIKTIPHAPFTALLAYSEIVPVIA